MKDLLKLWLIFLLLCSINLSIKGFVFTDHCLGHQQTFLLQLKESLIFNPLKSRKLVYWNQSADCCQWNGVTCNKGHVLALDLSEEFIFGGLDSTSSLFNLQYLKNLSLAYNDFHSVIPSEFQNLKHLTYLNLSNAGFEGQIPFGISHLKGLVVLDMSTSSISSQTLKLKDPNMATLLRNLTKITELYLDSVKVFAKGKEWCHALSSLQNLRVLSMSFCGLSGPIDSSLAKLESLSVIRLKQNNISSPVPDLFTNFSNLTTLQLSSCNLSGVFPRNIFHMQALQVLDISNNPDLEGGLPNFLHHGFLHTLNLSITKFSGQLPASIGNLRQLSTIDLSRCQFHGTLPGSMSTLTQLVYLDLSSNNFTGLLPSFNMSMNLTYLSLYQNDLRGEIAFAHLEGLTNLVIIDLADNSLNGTIPSSLFTLPSLRELLLSNNQLDGKLDEFPKLSFSVLEILDLSGNRLEGPILVSIFHLRRLATLDLAFNKFNGTMHLDMIGRLPNLSILDFSNNNLLVDASYDDQKTFPNMSTLMLASCKLTKFPGFLKNQFNLIELDLSGNQIQGTIPGWISQHHFLVFLNLSNNYLTSFEASFQNLSFLIVLDLHSNQFQGPIPILPKYAIVLNYANNRFNSTIPPEIGKDIPYIFYLSLSNNSLRGKIHESFCDALELRFLDLSHNDISGTIPECLTFSNYLRVLKLGGNKLTGHIPNTTSNSCPLRFLDLSANLLAGTIPRFLANCQKLEILDLGNNMLVDGFPCFLKNISTLRVLILSSNNLHGPIGCPNNIVDWEMLEIVDLSSNNFVGKLPRSLLRTWKAMLPNEDEVDAKAGTYGHSDMFERFDPMVFQEMVLGMDKGLGMKLAIVMVHLPRSLIEYFFAKLYYEDMYTEAISFTITNKGRSLKFTKMQTTFISMDFSSNHFEGPIPEELMNLKGLNTLNLSHNDLSGHIPSSIGNLQDLESLDLSTNSLNGEIPIELASLSFLEVLNLSFNHLVGAIPTGTQIQSFDVSSFEGNEGLCGPPLTQICNDDGVHGISPSTFKTPYSKSGNSIDWNFLSVELGFTFGVGVIIMPLIFLKQWRVRYSMLADEILCWIFPQLDFFYEHHEGQNYKTLRWTPR